MAGRHSPNMGTPWKILENVGKPWKPHFCVPASLCGVLVFPHLSGEGLDIVLLELLPPSVLPLLRPSQQRTPELSALPEPVLIRLFSDT